MHWQVKTFGVIIIVSIASLAGFRCSLPRYTACKYTHTYNQHQNDSTCFHYYVPDPMHRMLRHRIHLCSHVH